MGCDRGTDLTADPIDDPFVVRMVAGLLAAVMGFGVFGYAVSIRNDPSAGRAWQCGYCLPGPGPVQDDSVKSRSSSMNGPNGRTGFTRVREHSQLPLQPS